jgi:hypothetical protein
MNRFVLKAICESCSGFIIFLKSKAIQTDYEHFKQADQFLYLYAFIETPLLLLIYIVISEKRLQLFIRSQLRQCFNPIHSSTILFFFMVHNKYKSMCQIYNWLVTREKWDL